jgi:hypothetical protein
MYYITYKQWTSHQMKVAYIEPQYRFFKTEEEVISFLDELKRDSEILQPEKFYYEIIQIIKGQKIMFETVETHKLIPNPFASLDNSMPEGRI